MLIKIHTTGIELNSEILDHADSKLRLMLGLYVDKIRRIDIFFADVNGPKGGEDIQCKIKVDAFGQMPIIVQETATSAQHAVDICAHRVKRSTMRRFDRASDHKRDMSARRTV